RAGPAEQRHGRQRGAAAAAPQFQRRGGGRAARHAGSAHHALSRTPGGVATRRAAGLSGGGHGALSMAVRNYLHFKDFTLEEYEYLFERTRWIKDMFKRYVPYQPLRDRTLAMVFEKHSTRTRVSFEAGMHQLGGSVITLMTRDT